ncbi:MAG: family 10 glycosylhydrolase [Muribaculaceae bacterium]|nr:family 10 glycosylhydrolase [Muribaculaceae bacterium]
MCKLRLALFTILSILCISTISADTYPKRELRAAWVTVTWNNDWPTSSTATTATKKAEVETYLDLLKENGFNAAFLQVRGMSDRIYAKNTYGNITVNEPWSSYVSGTRGTDPGWDPLAYWIEQAHIRGMELHAWINPYRFGNRVSNPAPTSTNYPYNTTTEDKEATSNGLIISYLNPTANDAGNFTRYYIFNPALDAVKTRIKNICQVLTYNYDIDGIVFDDYFYPEGIGDEGTAADDYQDYTNYVNNGGTMEIGDWRRNNVNDMVSQVYNAIKTIKPYVKFGISPAGAAYDGLLPSDDIPPMSNYCKADDWQYHGIFSDPMYWMRNKIVDYLSPQLYWKMDHATNGFDEMATWWHIAASKFGRHYYASHTLSFITNASTSTTANFTEIQNQIEANRNTAINNNPGSVLFSLRNFSGKLASGLAPHLKEYTFIEKALTPATTWYATSNPGKPKNFNRSGSTLSWDAATMSDGKVSNICMRYAVYAIPLDINPVEASSTVHSEDGGYKSEYLLDITYSNSYTGAPTGDYWYAVTIVDRYGNEWEAATIDAPPSIPVNISLLSPESGITADATSQTFSWEGDEGALFTLQISDDSNFTNIVSETSTTNMSATISTGAFNENITYYWRVIASRSSYITTTTETRTFKVPTRPSLTVRLTTPENGVTIGEENETFSWEAIEDASYTLEIATDNTFSDVKISKNLSTASYTLTTSDLSYASAYYWRITAIKSGYKNSFSETRSFLTPDAPRVMDPATYDTVNNITIKNLWINSLNTGNYPTELSSADNPRSMTALKGFVYVSNRTTNNAGELIAFDGNTGDYIKTITLTGDYLQYSNGNTASYPCNCIFIDNAGNLCTSNMVTSFNGSNHLTVNIINPETGITTRVFQSDITATNMRIDYAAAFGDITSENGQIWAAISYTTNEVNTNRVYRWTRDASGNWTAEYTTISTYYPSTATHNGYGPYVMPISDSEFIIDGTTCNPTKYKFVAGGSATLANSFNSNTALKPASVAPNGMCAITLGDTPMFVYANNTNSTGSGFNYIIASNPSTFSYSAMSKMWEIPQNGLGTVSNGWFRNDVASLNNNDGSVTIFTYTAKNGLAAYRLSLPQLDKATLLSPAKGEQTAKIFDFNWKPIDGANYTVEISQSLAFDGKITTIETGTKNFLSSSELNLTSQGIYYWRVKAEKAGYTSSVSDASWFIAPEIKTWVKPVIWGPTDKETVDFDVSFVVTKTYETDGETRNYADATYLEISKDPNFNELYFSGHSNWQVNVHADVEWLQYTVPVSYFTNGLYYWRARAVEDGWPDGITEVRTFIVVDQSDELTSNYSLIREGYEYPVKSANITGISNSLTLTSLWIRSVEKGNALDATEASTGLYRGFCARHDNNGDQDGKDILWVAGRSENTTSAIAFLDKYDATTGEYLGQLTLGSGYSTSYRPCNDVFLDDANNICIHNMALANGTLQIVTVDPKNGKVAERFSTKVAERIDHARVVGDATSKNFYVVAASPNSTIYRWTVSNGSSSNPETQTISGYYPSKAASTTVTTFGTAPRIYPVSSSYFYIDGSSTAFTLYKWGQSTPVGSFASTTSTEIIPSHNQGNGGTFFYHNDIPMIVYAADDQQATTTGYKFNVAGLPNGHYDSFAGITKYYTIPNTSFGSTVNGGGDHAVLVDYLQYDAATYFAKAKNRSTNGSEDMTKIFLYVPGNGMASYTLIDHIVTGAESTLAEPQVSVTVSDGFINFGCEVETAQLYSLSGNLVAATTNTSFMEVPFINGVYILSINSNRTNSTHKIIIK